MKAPLHIDDSALGHFSAFSREQSELPQAQNWDEIERPEPGHPDWVHLGLANDALGKLRRLKANPNLSDAFIPHVDLYQKELQRLATFLRSREHRVAFVGSIGVGKSTAICKLVGLVKPGEGRLRRETVLETGGGRTTLCEVRIAAGERYGLRIEPRTDESIRKDVEDYAEYLIQRVLGDHAGGEVGAEEHDGLGISREVIRAIKNMAGLAGREVENGTALDLAVRYPRVDELTDRILARMNLPDRPRKDEWYVEDDKTTPMQWLQNIFKEVNNGRHPQFTLPERIEVVLPHPVLASEQFSVAIIDTKGIDQTAERRDLASLFDDPRTMVVLCSGFRDAPEDAIQTLLGRARKVGARDVGHKTLVLVLPQHDEARSVKDDQDHEAESDEEGYSLKQGHIELSLRHLGLACLPVLFYNAGHEPAETVRGEILSSIAGYRQLYRDSIEQLSKDVDRN